MSAAACPPRRRLQLRGVTCGRPPSTPLCLFRRETGLHRDSYRAACLVVRSVVGGCGRRQLLPQMARQGVADAEYSIERIYVHTPAQKSVQAARAFGCLTPPDHFKPFFSDLHRKDDRCTTLLERPHPYLVCRPVAFSLHWRQTFTDLEQVDIASGCVTRRVRLVGPRPTPGARPQPPQTALEAARTSHSRPHPPAIKYIHHDLERNELLMSSVQSEDALATVIVFCMWPLQFLLHFQILRRDFPHVDSVSVGEGVVMLSSRSRGMVSLYSLDTLLKERKFIGNLDDEVTLNGQRYLIGQHPHGLPINSELRPDAPAIASFPARQGYLEIGATPYHVVTKGKEQGFQVCAVADGSRALNCDSLTSVDLSPDAATFIDDGPFLVQHSVSEIRVHDLRSQEVVLHLNAGTFADCVRPNCTGPVTTRSGRSVRVRRPQHAVTSLAGSDWRLAWDLEDELDLIVVVIVEEEVGEVATLRRLLVFDRLTWRMTSDTPLNHVMPLAGAGLAEVVVVLDRCLLFVKLRSTSSKCTALVYHVTVNGSEPPCHVADMSSPSRARTSPTDSVDRGEVRSRRLGSRRRRLSGH